VTNALDALKIGASVAGCLSLVRLSAGGVAQAWRRTAGQRRFSAQVARRMSVGVTREFVEEVLGKPIIRRAVLSASVTESIYRLPSAWVQTIADGEGNVLRYSVTITDRRATILVGEQAQGQLSPGPIVLGRTKFSDLRSKIGDRCWFPGNTAPSYYCERFSFGNPGLYLTYWLSYNDAGFESVDLPRFANLPPSTTPDNSEGMSPKDLSNLNGFREISRPNTYTCASVKFNDLSSELEELRLGVSRLDLRVLSSEVPRLETPVFSRRLRRLDRR